MKVAPKQQRKPRALSAFGKISCFWYGMRTSLCHGGEPARCQAPCQKVLGSVLEIDIPSKDFRLHQIKRDGWKYPWEGCFAAGS